MDILRPSGVNAAPTASTTPMMRQWQALKDAFPDTILLFRLGDFYEMFREDAEIGARELSITLTGREAGPEGRVPMCGVPHHALDPHVARLVSRGYRVAICDQTEDPSQAKGIVERRVTRIVTPGSRIEAGLVDERRNTYLAAVCPEGRPRGALGGWGLAFADVSTGELSTVWVPQADAVGLWERVLQRNTAEVVFPFGAAREAGGTADRLQLEAEALGIVATPRPASDFHRHDANERLCRHFGVRTLAGFAIADRSPEAAAAGGLLAYIEHTLQGPARHVTRIVRQEGQHLLRIDESTRKNLEISLKLDGGENGSLVWAVDQTVTSLGARLLRAWMSEPLAALEPLVGRQEAVAGMVADGVARAGVRRVLKGVHDVERLVARIAAGRAGPRDLAALRQSLVAMPELIRQGDSGFCGALADVVPQLSPPQEFVTLLQGAIADDPPATVAEGGAIADGWAAELDDLRAIRRESRERISALEDEERRATGIRSLRVGFNRVFGYYIEVTKANLASVPERYIRKQTLANGERYATQELKELEERLLHAEEHALALESSIFADVCAQVLAELPGLQALAAAVALCDVVAGLAEVAAMRGYVRPELRDEPVLHLRGVRHAVVEALLGEGRYVPADLNMDDDADRFHLLTGPNMAGKSTYGRAVALVVVLAQIGSFVPADAAVVGLADALYSRIGARDDLAGGESTFMREMVETSRILTGATRRSVVVVDEVGRGTSTYDGLAIAWAVAEDLAARIGARTIFTTHYHELTTLAERIPAVRNFSMAVREDDQTGRIEFLHTVVPGAADRSYGLHVAAIAGVPEAVIERAADILSHLEDEQGDGGPSSTMATRDVTVEPSPTVKPSAQISLLAPGGDPRAPHPLEQLLAAIDLDALPPRDALALLYDWKRRFGKRGR